MLIRLFTLWNQTKIWFQKHVKKSSIIEVHIGYFLVLAVLANEAGALEILTVQYLPEKPVKCLSEYNISADSSQREESSYMVGMIVSITW